MPKKHIIQLSIPQPCTQGWDKMTLNEQGRHCDSCNKTVVDFTLFTDRQIIEFFEKAKGKICGNFTSLQLQRQLVYTEPQNHFLYKLLFGTAIAVGFAGSANASYNPKQMPLIEQYGVGSNSEKEPLGGGISDTLRIKIIDFGANEPVAHVLVELMYGQKRVAHAYTDANGMIVFKGVKKYDRGMLYAKCSKDGYIVKTIDVEDTTNGYFMIPIININNEFEKLTVLRGDTIAYVPHLAQDSLLVKLTDSITGSPLVNTTVHLYLNGNLLSSTHTDPFGYDELLYDRGLIGSKLMVRINAEGYLPFEEEFVIKEKDFNPEGFNFNLKSVKQ